MHLLPNGIVEGTSKSVSQVDTVHQAVNTASRVVATLALRKFIVRLNSYLEKIDICFSSNAGASVKQSSHSGGASAPKRNHRRDDLEIREPSGHGASGGAHSVKSGGSHSSSA